MKKLLSLFFALIATTAIWASNTITYTATEKLTGHNNSLAIGEATFGSPIISHTFNNGAGTITCNGEITTIRSSAFENCYNLTSMTIPNSVTTIGEYAFCLCKSMTSITIPNSVTSIGSYAFRYCHQLASISLPNSVTSIGGSAFEGCSNLTSIEIPNSITAIRSMTFKNCSRLKSITIPNSVTSIGSYAFFECYGLTSIIIPNSITAIGDKAFANCYCLTSITIPNFITKIESEVFSGCYRLTSVIIPNSVTTIESEAFKGCHGLTSVTISNSVTKIGFKAFLDCIGLTCITIPHSVTTIEDATFSGCSGLTSITIPNSVTTIKSAAFSRCSGLISLTIPTSVKEIGKDVFKECSKLKTIYDGSGILANNKYSFGVNSSCKVYDGVVMGDYVLKSDTIITNYIGNETSASIPNSITTIGNNAFYGCTGLTSVAIPTSVTTIGDNAFYGCTGLTSVAIPTSVTTIGDNAFYGCSIENLYCSKKVDLGNTAKYIKHIYRLADEDLIAFFPFATYAIQYITPRINEWQKKGELEKTSDWQARVTETTRKQKVGEYLKEAQNIYIKAFYKLRTNDFSIDTYDSDNEVYLVRDKEWGNILISVPINEAQYVRQKWSSCKTTPHYAFAGNEVILQSVDFTFPNKKTYTYKSNQQLTYSTPDIKYNFNPIELPEMQTVTVGGAAQAPQAQPQAAQYISSVTITTPVDLTPMSSVLVSYKNIFGKYEMPDLDVTFPYVVIRVKLQGTPNLIRLAKQSLSLDLGQSFIVEQTVPQDDKILFLVPTGVRNIYLTDGNGQRQLLYSGRLQPNTIYDGTVEVK